MVLVLTGGERHEQPILPILMERAAVKRQGRGRPRIRPDRVAGDTGYSSAEIRTWLQEREIAAVIPYREDEMGSHDYDRAAYRERSLIERTINRLKRYRRIATRYDILASSYLAMVTIACILEWL